MPSTYWWLSKDFFLQAEVLVLFLFGLIIGSFLNVCIYRIPRGNFLAQLRSFCPHCKTRIAFFDNIPVLSYFFLLGDTQSLANNLSSFSGHLKGMKPILERATAQDLVLLDELCIGTEPTAGAALAQAMLEELETRKPITLVSTHFDRLKTLALDHKHYRNACMEYSQKKYKHARCQLQGTLKVFSSCK